MLGPLMHKYIVEITGRKTVPNIICKSDLIGGSKQLTEKLESGELKEVLDKNEISHSIA